MSVVTVYATFTYAGQAQSIGMTAVEEGLAACVNILQPCRSIFRWQGEIQSATETPALFKTTLDKADALIARKEQLVSEQQAARTSGLSRRQRAARRPANRRRYRELNDVTTRLAALADRQRAAARQDLEQIDRELAANAVLQSREFSFALYPAETLRTFLTDLPTSS